MQGFIAQEVEKVLPQIALTQDDRENTKGLIPVLTKAVQEMKADNDNLRAANDNEAREIRALVTRLDAEARDIEQLKAARH